MGKETLVYRAPTLFVDQVLHDQAVRVFVLLNGHDLGP